MIAIALASLMLSLPAVDGVSVTSEHQEHHAAVQENETDDNDGQTELASARFNESVTNVVAGYPSRKAYQAKQPSVTDWFIVVFTGVLAGVGFLQWLTYRDWLRATKVIERGYISIDGDIGMENFGPNLSPRIIIRIRNRGKTPVTVSDVVINLPIRHELPPKPSYDLTHHSPSGSFVMSIGEDYTSSFVFNEIVISQNDYTHVTSDKADTMSMWVLGYLDYVDKFGDAHRFGFCRMYHEGFSAKANKAVFVGPRAAVGYNYDRDLGKHKEKA